MWRRAAFCFTCLALLAACACSPGPGGPPGPQMPTPEESARALSLEIEQRLGLDKACMNVVRPAILNFFRDREALASYMNQDGGRPDPESFARKMGYAVDDAMDSLEGVLDPEQMKTVRFLLEKNAAMAGPGGRGPGGPGGPGRGGGGPPGGGRGGSGGLGGNFP